MNINQVKYFVSVVDLRSFSEAAKAQGVTVQAVSKAIGDLEREASTKLFERTSHGVIPTQAGTAFCEKARPVRDAFLQLEDFVAGKCEQPAPHAAPHAPPCGDDGAQLGIESYRSAAGHGNARAYA